MKLWDLRMLDERQSALLGVPRCLKSFQGHREAIGGLAVHGPDAVSFAGPYLGVLSLQVGYLRKDAELPFPMSLATEQ